MGSCSHFGNRSSEIRTVEPIPQWLKVAPRFAHRSEEGYYATHAFFDFIPLPDLNSSKINFVLLTPEGSRYGYDINLHSGQIYKRHKYCPQTDTWKSTSTEINLPPYSEGFVPRILDQLGDPLKIIVYGENEYLSKDLPDDDKGRRIIDRLISELHPDSFSMTGSMEDFTYNGIYEDMLEAGDPLMIK